MNLSLETLGVLSLVGQQVTENLLGLHLKKEWMKLAAIGVTIGLAFVGWQLDVDGLKGLDAGKVAILGLLAGLGSNVTHALFSHFIPSSKGAPIAGLLEKMRPPAPPAPPTGS